jgi:hypothetical protein
MGQNWVVGAAAIVVVALAVGLLYLASRVLKHALATALDLFVWAAENGFIGIALYIIIWVVATPLMIGVCIVGGVIRLVAEFATHDHPISSDHPISEQTDLAEEADVTNSAEGRVRS